MNITVFTSNQPRHLSLIESLSAIADTVFAVQECNTIFPGQVEGFFRKSPVMQEYFTQVIDAERQVFGRPRFVGGNVRTLSMQANDLSKLELEALAPALRSDYYIVFGASYIRGPLCDFIEEHGGLNIHMGTSPYYRGSSCNFWALYDGRPDYVGATVHLLTKGLDSGAMLFHALPPPREYPPFLLGMTAVKVAHQGLVENIRSGAIRQMSPIAQDKSQELRYTRNRDFDDDVAKEFLANPPNPEQIAETLSQRDLSKFLNPYCGL